MLPRTVQAWIVWLIARSATWAVFAWLDQDRWWDSAAYDFMRSILGIHTWGIVWAACAAGMTAGLTLRRLHLLRATLGVWLTVQAVMAISVGVLVASGTLTAITALGHFADSVVATGIILASGRLTPER